MRKLFIIFLLIIHSLSGFAYGQNTDLYINKYEKNQQFISSDLQTQNTISVDFKGYENAILKLGQNQEEISVFLFKNNNKTNNPEKIFCKTNPKIKLCKNNSKTTLIKFNNISFILRNNICSRAP